MKNDGVVLDRVTEGFSGEVTFKQKLLRPEKIRREFPAEAHMFFIRAVSMHGNEMFIPPPHTAGLETPGCPESLPLDSPLPRSSQGCPLPPWLSARTQKLIRSCLSSVLRQANGLDRCLGSW